MVIILKSEKSDSTRSIWTRAWCFIALNDENNNM